MTSADSKPTNTNSKKRLILAGSAAGLVLVAAAGGIWVATSGDAPKARDPRPALKPIPEGFVLIEAGVFSKGSPDHEVKREPWNSDETQYEVILTHDFEIQKTEVTQGLWAQVLKTAIPDYQPEHRFQACGEACPAETVSWYEAVAFANLFSAQKGDLQRCYKNASGEDYSWEDAKEARPVSWEGGFKCAGYRLPTEAEWEFAARGQGQHKERSTYAGDHEEDVLDGIAWYVNNREALDYGIDCADLGWKGNDSIKQCGPQPVGQKEANDHGLHDMIGNVWEWTWDWHGAYPEGTAVNPTGQSEGEKKVLRGCSWYIHPSGCRVAGRSEETPDTRNGNLGLRLARSVF